MDEVDLWEKIKINSDTDILIKSKLRHITFAKIIYHISMVYKINKITVFNTPEITRLAQISTSRAYQILRNLCDLGLLRRDEIRSNITNFYIVFNNHSPKILKYFEQVKMVLEEFIER